MFLDELGKIPSLASWLGQLQARLLPGMALLLGATWLLLPIAPPSLLPHVLQASSPWALPLQAAVQGIANPTVALVAVFVALLVALGLGALITLFNTQWLRLMAGYGWEDTALGRWLTARQRARLTAL